MALGRTSKKERKKKKKIGSHQRLIILPNKRTVNIFTNHRLLFMFYPRDVVEQFKNRGPL